MVLVRTGQPALLLPRSCNYYKRYDFRLFCVLGLIGARCDHSYMAHANDSLCLSGIFSSKIPFLTSVSLSAFYLFFFFFLFLSLSASSPLFLPFLGLVSYLFALFKLICITFIYTSTLHML